MLLFNKYNVKNKERFAVFSIILFSALILLALSIFSFAKHETLQVIASANSYELTDSEIEFIDKFEKKEIKVKKGDTAWSIQQRLSPSSDIREVLYHVEKINEQTMGKIKNGEKLIFLKERGQ